MDPIGRPPRRLALLHLDGAVEHLPPRGSAVELDGTQIGFTGSTARHHELGPIALAVIKCNVDVAATQEVIVDSEAGLHFRPTVG